MAPRPYAVPSKLPLGRIRFCHNVKEALSSIIAFIGMAAPQRIVAYGSPVSRTFRGGERIFMPGYHYRFT